MANNWIVSVQNNAKPSETVDEIVAIKEDDLIDLHFTLGLAIRNAFGLHDLGSKLLLDCSVVHPDDASGAIILNLWGKL